jgi:hypothetical protein
VVSNPRFDPDRNRKVLNRAPRRPRSRQTLTQTTPEALLGIRLAARIGFWAGLWATTAAAAFPVAVVVGSVLFPQSEWAGDTGRFATSFTNPLAWSAGEIVSLLIIPGWVGLAVAIHISAPEDRNAFTLIALVLTGAYVATVGANDFVQITTV